MISETSNISLIILITLVIITSVGAIQFASAYEEDIHYYWTFFLALYVGFSWEEAHLIASGDFRQDETDLKASLHDPDNFNWHALSTNATAKNQRLAELKQSAFVETDTNMKLVKFGQYLHYLQDMEPHDGYGSSYGHFSGGHKPDSPGYNKTKFEITTTNTLNSLNDLLENLNRTEKTLNMSGVMQPIIDEIHAQSKPFFSGNKGQVENRATIERAIHDLRVSEGLNVPSNIQWNGADRPLIPNILKGQFDMSGGSDRGEPIKHTWDMSIAYAYNLVTNGNFESPELTKYGWNVFDSAEVGWDVSWVAVPNCTSDEKGHTPLLELMDGTSLTTIYGPAANGNQWAELDSDCGGPTTLSNHDERTSIKISQDIPTDSGGVYQLTFDTKKRHDAASNGLRVSINNDVIFENNTLSDDWHVTTLNFIAQNQTQLSFEETETPDSFGTFLDNVSLKKICDAKPRTNADFISGFSASSGDVIGIHALSNEVRSILEPVNINNRSHTTLVADNTIENFLTDNPCGKIVIIGHSYGGDTAIEIAQDLVDDDIKVDLLIQIDSVGIGDEELPSNVIQGVNLFSTSNIGKNSVHHVNGSINIGFDNTTHTDIDDNVGVSSQTGYVGKVPFDVIREFILKLPLVGINHMLEDGGESNVWQIW